MSDADDAVGIREISLDNFLGCEYNSSRSSAFYISTIEVIP